MQTRTLGRETRALVYDDYPVEQVARSRRARFQLGFARLTMHLLPSIDGVAYEPSSEGLRILATDETALGVPGEIVRQIHDDDVELDAPRVRLTMRGRPCEPVMNVRLTVPEERAAAVVADLAGRDARIDEIDCVHGRATVRAVGPLRNLLGYPEALVHLGGRPEELAMWLSHYTPVDAEAQLER
jgi:predicted membrane GTPase involved in stress response